MPSTRSTHTGSLSGAGWISGRRDRGDELSSRDGDDLPTTAGWRARRRRAGRARPPRPRHGRSSAGRGPRPRTASVAGRRPGPGARSAEREVEPEQPRACSSPLRSATDHHSDPADRRRTARSRHEVPPPGQRRVVLLGRGSCTLLSLGAAGAAAQASAGRDDPLLWSAAGRALGPMRGPAGRGDWAMITVDGVTKTYGGSRPSTTCPSSPSRAGSPASSGRTAPASPPRCASWSASRRPARGASRSAATATPTSRTRAGTSACCSTPPPSTPAAPAARSSPSAR